MSTGTKQTGLKKPRNCRHALYNSKNHFDFSELTAIFAETFREQAWFLLT